MTTPASASIRPSPARQNLSEYNHLQTCVPNSLGGPRLNVGMGKLMESVLAAFAQFDNDAPTARAPACARPSNSADGPFPLGI